jgi:hypothetical protein
MDQARASWTVIDSRTKSGAASLLSILLVASTASRRFIEEFMLEESANLCNEPFISV